MTTRTVAAVKEVMAVNGRSDRWLRVDPRRMLVASVAVAVLASGVATLAPGSAAARNVHEPVDVAAFPAQGTACGPGGIGTTMVLTGQARPTPSRPTPQPGVDATAEL